MTLQEQLDEIERLAKDPDLDSTFIFDLMELIGSDSEGIAALVDRFGGTSNTVLIQILTFVLSRATWNWGFGDARLVDPVLMVASMRTGRVEGNEAVNLLNAIFGLEAAGLLVNLRMPVKQRLEGYILVCLSSGNHHVVSGCLDLLTHVAIDEFIDDTFMPGATAKIRHHLDHISSVFDSDIAKLRKHWPSLE